MKYIFLSNLILLLNESLNGTKSELLFDTKTSNIWKIVFLSVCVVIIVTAVVVLLIKTKITEKKKKERK